MPSVPSTTLKYNPNTPNSHTERVLYLFQRIQTQHDKPLVVIASTRIQLFYRPYDLILRLQSLHALHKLLHVVQLEVHRHQARGITKVRGMEGSSIDGRVDHPVAAHVAVGVRLAQSADGLGDGRTGPGGA